MSDKLIKSSNNQNNPDNFSKEWEFLSQNEKELIERIGKSGYDLNFDILLNARTH